MLSVCCFLLLHAYGQTEGLFHTSFAQRERILDSLFHTRSIIGGEIADSAVFYTLTESGLKKAKKEGDDKLYEHLKLEQFRYRLKTTDSLTITPAALNSFINSLETEDKKYFIPSAQQAYANKLSDLRYNLGLASELYIKAYYAYEDFSREEFPFKASMLYDMALAYYRFHDYDHTIRYISMAIDGGEIDYAQSVDMINILALSYRETGKYDSALYFFNKIIASSKEESWNYISTLNIGQTYLLQEKYDEAATVFDSCYRTGVEKQVPYMISEAGVELGRIAFMHHNEAAAETYVRSVIELWKDRLGSNWHYQRMDAAKLAYELLADIYEKKGDYRAAYLYKDTFLLMKDSLASSYDALKLSSAQNNVLLAKYEQDMQRVIYERQRNILIRNILLVFILLAAIITFLFVKNQQLRRRKLEADKQNAEDKLRDFTRALSQKTQLVEQFSRELEQYKAREDDSEYNETLIQLQQSTILTDEEWVDFRNRFEQVHKGFLHRLKTKLPDLTPAEVRFMVLSKLKFSPKDMANILGVGPSAIRKYRYRLRNKLHLPEDGSIDEVVDLI